MAKIDSSRSRGIAFDVGFSEPFHFSRVFRTITGNSPSAWRKQQA